MKLTTKQFLAMMSKSGLCVIVSKRGCHQSKCRKFSAEVAKDDQTPVRTLLKENLGCRNFLSAALKSHLDLKKFECHITYDLPKHEIRQ